MTHDSTIEQADEQIILNDAHEVRSWTFALACTEAELRLAVHAAGTSAEAVRAHLEKKISHA